MSHPCRYSEDIKLTDKLAQQTLEQIRELTVPATPVHFTLLYEKLMEPDAEVSRLVNELIENKEYNNDAARLLFMNLLSQIIQKNAPAHELNQLINSVLHHLDEWNSQNHQFNRNLESSIDCLKRCKTPQQVEKCVQSNILPPIEKIQQHNQTLHQQIEGSAEVIRQLKLELEQATSLSETDSLTGIANRRGYEKHLNQFVHQAQEEGHTFAMLLLDLDLFKRVNDQFGHLVGDSALRYIAKTLSQKIGERDLVARLGGEEFVILLHNTTYDNALKNAEAIRSHIQSKSLRVKNNEQPLKFTLSIGAAIYQMGEPVEQLFERADKALYLAKTNGRNRCYGEHQI